MADPIVSVDGLMADVQARVRERLRTDLVLSGVAPDFEDPELFATVERLCRGASAVRDTDPLILPELLGEPSTWRLDTAMRLQSHRGGIAGPAVMFVKRRLLMPLLRWLFEYSRDNFERQRRVNRVLFACVQELAIESARLRRDLDRLSRS